MLQRNEANEDKALLVKLCKEEIAKMELIMAIEASQVKEVQEEKDQIKKERQEENKGQ